MSDSDSTTTVPLTSIFTPPPDCSSSWTYEASAYNSVSRGLLLQNALDGDIPTSCWPSGYTHGGRLAASFVFSPGACPDGYTTNAGATTVDATTMASCCLDDFYFTTNGDMQGCISTFTGTTFLAARAGGLQTETDYTSSTTVSGTIQMWAQALTVVHRSVDESLYITSTTTPATPESTATSTASSTSTDTDTTETNDIDNDSSRGLSAGAKAGIAVGAVAGALLLVGFAFLFWRRSKKRRVAGQEYSQPSVVTTQAEYGGYYAPPASNSAPSELPAKQVSPIQGVHELQ
ncbi:hypothetical protein BDW72DRAFT_188308 [Aspergillus terricola var. indicus]